MLNKPYSPYFKTFLQLSPIRYRPLEMFWLFQACVTYVKIKVIHDVQTVESTDNCEHSKFEQTGPHKHVTVKQHSRMGFFLFGKALKWGCLPCIAVV